MIIDVEEVVDMVYSRVDAKGGIPGSSLPRTGKEDFARLETLALRNVHKKRVKSSIKIFFIHTTLFIADLFFLYILVLLFYELPYFVFKIGTLISLVISISYFCSLQARRIYQARQHRYLTSTQLMHATDEHRAARKNGDSNDDRKYLSLLKQDTAAYMCALKVKMLRKGSQ